MKVLQMMASGARGGGADHLLRLSCELTGLGTQCSAAVGADGPLLDQLADQEINTWPLNLMDSRLSLRCVRALAQIIRQASVDIVHAHGTRAAYYLALARPFLRGSMPPVVYTVHGVSYRKPGFSGTLTKPVFKAAERLSCGAAREVISVSNADLLDLRQRGCLPPTKGVHIPNAVDVNSLRPGNARAARRRIGLSQSDKVVGTVSRLVPQKALEDLLQAVSYIKDTQLRTVIVGDGPKRSELQSLARRLGVAERVLFLGSRDDVPELLAAFDVFVLSSHWEGEPIALLEGMAAGLPCVATATDGAQEIITHDKNGILVDVGSPASLAQGLANLLHSEGRRQELGEAARVAMLGRTHARQAQRVAAVYEAVLRT